MDPPEYLRSLLASAREDFGLSFDDAWPPAVIRAAGISSNPHEWLMVLASCRDAWERAFVRELAT